MINLETVQDLVNTEDFAKQLGSYLAFEMHNDGISSIDHHNLLRQAGELSSDLVELLESGFITDSNIISEIETLLNKFNNYGSFSDECLAQAQASLNFIREDLMD